jgi:hypothetical protein
MAKDKYEDYDGTPASNTDVGGINIQGSASIANGDNALREIMSHTADHFAGDTIASASTTDLGSKSAHYLEVTGTTTITAFGTIKAGTVKFLRFSGALTLTHNATSLILTTGASVITVAGDMAIAVSEGSGNWRVTFIRGTAALARGVDLATAGTLNLDSVEAPCVALTGTTTVTAVTLTSRRWRICRADAAFQMTASASLIVNGSTTVNYTTTANDLLLFEGYGSGVVRVWLIGAPTYLPTSGTYTPTLFNTTNVAASTANVTQYIRIGNIVWVAGNVDIDPTAAGPTITVMGMSLPIASNFSSAIQAGGTCNGYGFAGAETYAIIADAANDRVTFTGAATTTANHSHSFIFMYQVI